MSHYIIIYSRTACLSIYKRRAITGSRSVGGSASSTRERRPRRPTGALVVSMTAGYRKGMVSAKRGTPIESKFPDLLVRAEALASEVHADHERDAAMRRQEESESRRRYELERRIDQLDRNVAAWRRAQRIRAYIQVGAGRMEAKG